MGWGERQEPKEPLDAAWDVPQIGSPNRATRRAADKQGLDLPVVQIAMFPNGQVKIDKHNDVTNAQIRTFLTELLLKLPNEDEAPTP